MPDQGEAVSVNAWYSDAWDLPVSVEAEVLLDTSAIILLFYSGEDEEKLRMKDFFHKITTSCRCCISPITVGELMTDKWYASLGAKRAEEHISELREFEFVIMNYATGRQLSQLKWPTHKRPGPNDRWQVSIASLHGLSLATTDYKMQEMCDGMAEIWTPPKIVDAPSG